MVGTFELLVLLTIRILKEDAYGRQIAQMLGAFVKPPSDAQVYMALRRLEKKKMIGARPPLRAGARGRPRIVYGLTKEGCSTAEQLTNAIIKLDLEGRRNPETGKILLKMDPDLQVPARARHRRAS